MNTSLLDKHSVSFFGRPFDEPLKCFGLQASELEGMSVLECPSGPSGFVAECARRGIEAVGIDPLFYRSPEAIRTLAESDFRTMFARMRQVADRFVRKTYQSIDEAELRRREGLDTFLNDYRSGVAVGRYRAGALPCLDFPDAAFDLVLCGHLLFVYADQFDLGFHLRSIEELCRLARKEVRIHPLVDARNQPYSQLDEVIAHARKLGFQVCIQDVEHEFFRGSNQTLVLRRPVPVSA